MEGKRIEKQKAFKCIAEKFDTTEAEVQRKLHNLRTQANQEWNKIKKRKSGQGTDEIYSSSWEYFESLKFLVDQNMTSGSEDNLVELRKKSLSLSDDLSKEDRERINILRQYQKTAREKDLDVDGRKSYSIDELEERSGSEEENY
ncbi:unnamed protein product [Psylliodes chrysocephalus]|uniref:MADF domain-containing protein n=1 Tax=Psylliodes chrysocephalus TaxID=3402493 RepID=A0A9P0CYC5_9CUCU|nr:unnamed protein product [Psylliodes chrysocephala]